MNWSRSGGRDMSRVRIGGIGQRPFSTLDISLYMYIYTGKALEHGSMCFPLYELCIGILQAGQGQKSETNGCGRVRKRLMLDWTTQRMNANENCKKQMGWNLVHPGWKQGAVAENSKLPHAGNNMSQLW